MATRTLAFNSPSVHLAKNSTTTHCGRVIVKGPIGNKPYCAVCKRKAG